MSNLIPFSNPEPRNSTYLTPRPVRAALRTAEYHAIEAAARNELLGELTVQAVRNVDRYHRAVQSVASDSAYVAVAADAYFMELLEGQADELRRFRRGR